jgi:predicted anti-sigma-YlaC factor YlaD
MTICEREELVLELLRDGRDLAATELGAHVTECASCADLADVAKSILDENHAAAREAAVPTSGVVWWRMQRRARQEALRTAARTVTAVQAASVATAFVVAILIVGVTADWRGWLKTLAGLVSLPEAATLAQWGLPLAFGVMACLALAPVALYLSIARD